MNQVVSKRMVKKQQIDGTESGAAQSTSGADEGAQ